MRTPRALEAMVAVLFVVGWVQHGALAEEEPGRDADAGLLAGVTAEARKALETSVTIDVRRLSLRSVMGHLRKTAAIDFVVPDEILDEEEHSVTIAVKDKPVIDVLEALAESLMLRLSVTKNGVVVLAWRPELWDEEPEFDEEEEEAGGRDAPAEGAAAENF